MTLLAGLGALALLAITGPSVSGVARVAACRRGAILRSRPGGVTRFRGGRPQFPAACGRITRHG